MSSASSIPRVMILQMCNWFGAPRLPKAFRRAGFHVTTFGFPGLLMQRVQCVDESLLVSESISRDELVAALLDAMEHCRADLVIPTDDTTILLLHTAAMVARRSGRSASVHATLQRSLGNATYCPTVRSRKLLAAFAAQVGVRQPQFAAVFTEADALQFASDHGYPVVLKVEESAAGFGVFICRDEVALRAALLQASRHPAIFAAGLLAQTFVEGRTAMRVVAVQDGRVLGGLSAIKLETWPSSTGPSTCVEFIEHAEMRATTETLLSKLGYSGFASLDFMLDSEGRAYLIELNPRPTPIAHLGERLGSCLCRHLHAALTGQPSKAGEPQGLPSRVALFPQEWVRDQNSRHLESGVFHDVPWDEPDLVEGYLSMGRIQMRYSSYYLVDKRNEVLRTKLAELEAESS